MSVEADALERDGGRCFRCGTVVLSVSRSCHHRKLRSGGGPDSLENRITLCGSGTTGCHGYVHHHPREARESGFIVSRYAEPGEAPVLHHQLGWVFLVPDGGIQREGDRHVE